METITPELEKHARSIKEHGFPMKKPNSDLEMSTDSDSESDSDFEPERKRKSFKKNLHGMDMLYVDNQNLWKKLAKVKSELNVVEERLRYLQLEHNNKIVDISDLKQSNSNLKTDVKIYKTQNIQIVKSNKYIIFQRNICLLFWIATLILHIIKVNNIDFNNLKDKLWKH